MLELNGQAVPGQFFPAPPDSPSLVVIHEYWGLNAHILDVARRFNREGFSVFAIDVYGGKQATDAATASKYVAALDWKVAVALIGQALEALQARAPKTRAGVLGFCMGGGLALASAAAFPGFSACVPFYGLAPRLDAQKIKAKVLGHFATDDDWCSPDRVAAFEQQLKDAKVSFQLHRYDASHAFFNDTREVHSPASAALAWQRTLEFLHSVLG